jgi:hypothetical protein
MSAKLDVGRAEDDLERAIDVVGGELCEAEQEDADAGVGTFAGGADARERGVDARAVDALAGSREARGDREQLARRRVEPRGERCEPLRIDASNRIAHAALPTGCMSR